MTDRFPLEKFPQSLKKLFGDLKNKPQEKDRELKLRYDAEGKLYSISSHGIVVELRQSPEERTINTKRKDGKLMPLVIPGGTVFGRIDFTPLGRADYDPKVSSVILMEGLRGMNDILSVLEKNVVPMPKYFYGLTNPRMANFVKRFGFYEGDTNINLDGSADLEVIGDIEHIKMRLNELNNNTELIARLNKRAVKK